MSVERQLVGTLALRPELAGSLNVTPADFSDFRAGVILESVRNLIEKGNTPDPLIVAESLGEGWMEDVVDVFSYKSTPGNFDLMQENVKAKSRARNLEKVGRQFVEDLDVNALLKQVEKIEGNAANDIADASEVMTQLKDQVEARGRGEETAGLQTGFADLDDLAGGLVAGDSVVVAARTSVGKTAFMCNLAVNCGAPCGIISGEQSNLAIMRRITSKVGGLSMQKLKTGKLSGDEWSKFAKAQEKIDQSGLKIVDVSRPSISQVEQYARTMHWRHGIKVLFVDYLQLITNSAYPGDRRLQISDISARLKKLAKDLDIPVVTLAQLNRGAVDHVPRISDLKESGAIEEDADLIMLLYRENEQEPYSVTVDVQKNREGATGKTRLMWMPVTMTFGSEAYGEF